VVDFSFGRNLLGLLITYWSPLRFSRPVGHFSWWVGPPGCLPRGYVAYSETNGMDPSRLGRVPPLLFSPPGPRVFLFGRSVACPFLRSADPFSLSVWAGARLTAFWVLPSGCHPRHGTYLVFFFCPDAIPLSSSFFPPPLIFYGAFCLAFCNLPF